MRVSKRITCSVCPCTNYMFRRYLYGPLRYPSSDAAIWNAMGLVSVLCLLSVSLLVNHKAYNRVLGPKYHPINGIWALKPHYLGPWTLRDRMFGVGPGGSRTAHK